MNSPKRASAQSRPAGVVMLIAGIATLSLAIVVAFQILIRDVLPGMSQVSGATTTSNVAGYPAPILEDSTPQPYPGPPTIAPSTVIFGPLPTDTPNPLALTATAAPADGTTYDILNRIRIRLLTGWHAELPPSDTGIGVSTFLNYSYAELDALADLPLDLITIRITTHSLPADLSLDQWLSEQRQKQTSPEYGVPIGTTLTEPEPITVGNYNGLGYYQNPPTGGVWRIMYLFTSESRITSVSITPVNHPEGQSSLSEAMQILESIQILP